MEGAMDPGGPGGPSPAAPGAAAPSSPRRRSNTLQQIFTSKEGLEFLMTSRAAWRTLETGQCCRMIGCCSRKLLIYMTSSNRLSDQANFGGSWKTAKLLL